MNLGNLYFTCNFEKSMTTIKLTVNEKNSKGKHLLALLREMAKSDKDMLVKKVNEPNAETIIAKKETEAGHVTKVDNVDELFDSI